MSSVYVRTPAKLNLGLEVIGKRPDAYHELVTIFQAIDLYDSLAATPASEFEYVGDPRLPASIDIARPILEAAASEQGWTGRLELRKAIPIAAGLGGGSSDAALALRIAMCGRPSSEIRERAAALGADVPFFVEGGAALGTGVGEKLQRLPMPCLIFVIVTPDLQLPNKTARLFAGLTSDDLSDGAKVRAFADELAERGRHSIGREGAESVSRHIDELPNAFERQMLQFPAVRDAWQELESVTGRVALSGAGPTIYSWHATYEEARDVVRRIGGIEGFVHIARAISPHGCHRQTRAIRRLLARLSAPETHAGS
jgi:4-diphosphocytidyl-2-C-methyl-D-erythritol kinase